MTAHADPSAATKLAGKVLSQALDDALAQSLAHEALGLAAQQRQDLVAAVEQHRRAVHIAEDATLARRAAQARTSLAHALLARGDPQAALAEADRAAAALDGTEAAAALMRRALVLQRLGRLEEALHVYNDVLPLLRGGTDRSWEARLLTNRGVLQVYRLSFAAAERDLLRAEWLHEESGQTLAAAQVRHNLGFLAARRGDVPGALESYDAAGRAYAALGLTDWVGLADRCDVLVSARLLTEAEELAARAVDELRRAGMDADLAEARLTLANVKLLRGDTDRARSIARQAARQFAEQEREGWAVLSGYVVLRADWHGGDRSVELMGRARRTADALAVHGWLTAAGDAGLIAARIALERGDVATAEGDLVTARTARTRGPVELQALAWHAEALLRLGHGNRRGANAALRAGMRAVERHRATLGATELRVHVAGHASELARLGMRLAIESGSAERVLQWAERWRAGALFLRPMRPPDDDELAGELAALRQTVADIQGAAVSGGQTAGLLARQARLERSIQLRSRRARASPGERDAQFSLVEFGDALGERALVQWVRQDDDVWAVVVVDGDASLCRLGSHHRAATELEQLRFALTRVALFPPGEPGWDQARRAVSYAAEQLDSLLLAPLRRRLTDRPLVLVPTGVLHAVPWAVLPSCEQRAVTVAPSAKLWWQTIRRISSGSREGVLLVGCTDPPHAVGEVLALQGRYAAASVLVGEEATVDAVTAALERVDTAHLACHGRFRADNPLFSCLELEDGPLMVWDLERRSRTPRLLLLSACDSGLSAVQAGDDLMGLSAALFALGTSTLVASVVPVPDGVTRQFMIAVHDELAAGHPPATALARAATAPNADQYWSAVAGFVCFGAG